MFAAPILVLRSALTLYARKSEQTIEALRAAKHEVEQAHEEKEGIDIVPQAFHSHPATAKRIRVLEKRWAKLRRQGDFIELLPVPKVTAVPGKAAKEPAEHAE